jgi:Taurine catabolism dioxygenase TauD, TfdA family
MSTTAGQRATAAPGGWFATAYFDELRRRVLRPSAAWPAPAGGHAGAAGRTSLERLAAGLRDAAAACGVGLADLGEPLSAGELIALGDALGEVIPEHDPAIAAFVEQACVLNLRGTGLRGGRAFDMRFKPFTSEELLLHTEGSLRAEAERPRWIILQCLREAGDEAGVQTITVGMQGVAARLGSAAVGALRQTWLAGGSGPVVTGEPPVFSFRDPAVSGDVFESAHGATDPRDTVGALLEALYEPAAVRAVPWRRGTLAVIDNTRVFHGRTQGSEGERRHLQRVRVRMPTPAGGAGR